MNRQKIFTTAIVSILTSAPLLQGCIDGQKTNQKAEITSLQADTTVYLKQDTEGSPSCKINLDFMFLKPGSEKDSISQRVNYALQQSIFENKFATLSPEKFIDSVQNTYIANYRQDLEKFYEADLHNGMKKEDIPAWYNYEYEVSTMLAMGKDSIWNYSITNYQNTGGAHPNTWSTWINIDATTGKVLTKKDVFLANTDNIICELLLKQLLTEVNSRLETDTISTIDGLRSVGALLDVDLYVPDNFLLSEDGVHFLYNRYDIAPYSMGDFQLKIPYAEIETYLIKK